MAPAQLPEPPTRVGISASINGRILNTHAQRGCGVHPLTTGTNRDTPKIRNPDCLTGQSGAIRVYQSAKAFFSLRSMSIRVSLHSFLCSFPALNI